MSGSVPLERRRSRPASSKITVDPDLPLRPVSGILDIRDNHGFVRTEGFLPGPDDAYVPAAQIKRHGLRRGDLVTGAVRDDPRSTKSNPLARLDTVNGTP